jgi:hypothetical protein
MSDQITTTDAPPQAQGGQQPPAPQGAATAPAPQPQPPVSPDGQQADTLAPYRERLESVMQPVDPDNPDAGTVLDGLLELYAITSDPNREEDLYAWWEGVGDAYNFFDGDADGGAVEGDEDDLAALEEGQGGGSELEELRATVQQLQQKLEGDERERSVAAAQEAIQRDLESLMAQHGIQDDPNAPEADRASTVILRLASTYQGAQDAVARGVADFMRLTGQAQGQLVQQAGEPTAGLDGLDQLPPNGGGGGRVAPSLDGGQADSRIEPVASWGDARRIAMDRLRQAERAGA